MTFSTTVYICNMYILFFFIDITLTLHFIAIINIYCSYINIKDYGSVLRRMNYNSVLLRFGFWQFLTDS